MIDQLYSYFLESKGVSTDTRQLVKGELFFALSGPNFNGNKFAQQAIEKGCCYAVVDDFELSKSNPKLFYVKNTLEALQLLAQYHRRQFDIPVLGITGSNGKTTNKELINSVLSQRYNVLFTEGNLNNHIGVPLTLLRLSNSHEIAVVEMGANQIGDIEELCVIAEPNYGLITSIGVAHLEGFGSIEGIKKGKAELYHAVINNNGLCLVNQMAKDVPDLFKGNCEQQLLYGSLSNKPFAEINDSEDTLTIIVLDDEKSFKIHSNLIGDFQAINLLNAFVVGKLFDISVEDIIIGIETYIPENNRSQKIVWQNNHIILDAYNANPTSMEAALHSFENYPAEEKVVILGDMLELGEYSLNFHQAIVDLLKRLNLETIILVGDEFGKTKFENMHWFDNRQNAHAWIAKQHFTNKHLLVKGSRGIGLEKIFI